MVICVLHSKAGNLFNIHAIPKNREREEMAGSYRPVSGQSPEIYWGRGRVVESLHLTCGTEEEIMVL